MLRKGEGDEHDLGILPTWFSNRKMMGRNLSNYALWIPYLVSPSSIFTNHFIFITFLKIGFANLMFSGSYPRFFHINTCDLPVAHLVSCI